MSYPLSISPRRGEPKPDAITPFNPGLLAHARPCAAPEGWGAWVRAVCPYNGSIHAVRHHRDGRAQATVRGTADSAKLGMVPEGELRKYVLRGRDGAAVAAAVLAFNGAWN